jgi:hypothetical protein
MKIFGELESMLLLVLFKHTYLEIDNNLKEDAQ